MWAIATNRWIDYSRSLTTSFSSSIKVKNRVRLINRCQYMVSRMTKAQIGCNDTLALSISRIFSAKLTTPVAIVDRSGNEKNIMRRKSMLELCSSCRSMPISFCKDRFTLRINIFSTEFRIVVSTFDALTETTERNDTQNSPIYRDKHIACDKLFAVIWEKINCGFHRLIGSTGFLDKICKRNGRNQLCFQLITNNNRSNSVLVCLSRVRVWHRMIRFGFSSNEMPLK